LPDGGWVGMRHVLWAAERSLRGEHRLVGQSEDLTNVPIKRKEVLVDQGVSCHEVVIKGALEQRTNLIEAVVGQPMAIGHQDQKDIQQEGMLAESGPEAIT
jgi:hypothetical protein